MPTCSRCGKKGIFLKIDPIFKRCDKCVELERKEYQIEKEKREEEEKNRIEKTRKDREYHDRLIEKAKKREEEAYDADNFAVFMQLYNAAIKYYSEASEILLDAKIDYKRLINEKQWHIRDAIEKECNGIIKDSKGKYRNNKGAIIERSKKFRASVLVCKEKNEYDEETLLFAEKVLHTLSVKIGLDSLEMNKKRKVDFYDIDSLEGHDFEYWCADLMRNNGFEKVEVTQGSNDQGVDIVAEREEIRYAIQCKCYSSDLGNTPIQEVVAGKTYYKCQIGVVMTNRYFTPSARALAKATGTLLWDREKLEKMYSCCYGKMPGMWFKTSDMIGIFNKETEITDEMFHAVLNYPKKSDKPDKDSDNDFEMMQQMENIIYSPFAETERILEEFYTKYPDLREKHTDSRENRAEDKSIVVPVRHPAADEFFGERLARTVNQPTHRRTPAVAVQNAQPIKRKKLYNEKIEAVQKQEAVQDSASKEALFDAGDFFVVPMADLLNTDKVEKKAVRSTFKPDRPSMMREDGRLIIPDEKPVTKVTEFPKLKRAKEAQAVEDVLEYNYPPIDLLAGGEMEDTTNHAQQDIQKAQLLEDTLQSFGISAKLTGIAHGPAVTRFELQPAHGVKVSQITALANDIALHMAATSVRIEAPIPGKAAVGVEIPNDKVEMVRLRDVLESSEAQRHPSRIAVGLGKDNSGRYIVADIAKMPHVLIAGQIDSDISVCINSIIASILFRASPEEVKLILIDPKMVELSIYNNIPHLVCPVVTDPKKAASALDWAVAEMTKRYKLFAESGVRDIKGYNKKLKPGEKPMSQMVIIIEELAGLMIYPDSKVGDSVDSIYRLTTFSHHCGMHLVIVTQRPSVNVISSIVKANIPTRIAFSMASQADSRMIIDQCGAEKLLGNGDMLFVPNGMKPMRVQGAWVSDDEVHTIVEYIKQSNETVYDPDMLEYLENANRSDAEKEEFEAEYDPKLPEAVDIALDMGQVSISLLQRKMYIGYARAGRIIDEMARRGIVSEADGSKPRVVLITREQAQQMFEE